jgi:hypothetical protein
MTLFHQYFEFVLTLDVSSRVCSLWLARWASGGGGSERLRYSAKCRRPQIPYQIAVIRQRHCIYGFVKESLWKAQANEQDHLLFSPVASASDSRNILRSSNYHKYLQGINLLWTGKVS